MKNFRRAWLILIIAGGLLGCTWFQQPGGTTPTPQPTPTISPSPAALPEVTPTRAFPPVPRRITLKLWVPEFLDPYNETVGGSALTAQLNAFSAQHENVQVEVIAKRDTGSGGLYNLLSTAIDVAPSILPDVIVLNKVDVNLAVNAGLIQPMDDFSVSWSDYYPFAVDDLDRESGELYDLPFIADADHMVYREGIAAAPPISWTSVVTHGYSLLFPAGSPDALADDAVLAAYIGSGGRVVDEDGKALLDRSSLEQLYAFFFDMLNSGLINTSLAMSLPDAEAAWQLYQEGNGHLAPVPAGLYWENPVQGSLPIWVPNAQEKPITIARNWSLAIVTADPDRKQAAQQLIEWLVDSQHMSEISRSAMLLPTRRYALRQWGLLSADQLFLNLLLENAVPALSPEIDIPVRRALQFGLIAVLRRDVDTPEQAASYALTNLRQ